MSSETDSRSGDPLFSVKDSVVVVTGGLGQLGTQYALALATRGANVAIVDSAVDEQSVAARFGAPSERDRLMFLKADITDRGSLDRALEAIQNRWGAPHALINNAALDSPPDAPVSENGPFETYSEASFDRVMAVNVKGTALSCQVFGGRMAQERRGSIVNISSIYGLVSPDQRVYTEGFFKPVAYSASKSAIFNLTRYLATYWASSGVRVNTLTLAGVFNHQNPEFLAAYEARIPIARMARADEYCGAILFLVSAASSYMTGSNMVVDGGWTAW